MSVKVVILESAEQDLKELKAYLIKNFSHANWLDTYGELKKAIRVPKTYPLAGTIPDEFEMLNISQYRQMISGMNRIIYEVRQDILYIHLIADGRRSLNVLLTKRLLRTS